MLHFISQIVISKHVTNKKLKMFINIDTYAESMNYMTSLIITSRSFLVLNKMLKNQKKGLDQNNWANQKKVV